MTPRTTAARLRCLDPGLPKWVVPVEVAEELERELLTWETELSKVMPPDFKDWWQNSKKEWPEVARLVIEAHRKNEETFQSEIDRLNFALEQASCLYDATKEGAKEQVALFNQQALDRLSSFFLGQDSSRWCPRPGCFGLLKPGVATGQTYTTGVPDFPGQEDLEGQTISPGGPGKLVPCLKCDSCGHSITES